MTLFNSIFRTLFDLVLAPFSGMPAMVTLLPITVLFTLFALYVFKWTSNQEAMDRVKAKIHASIFEIRLFNDDMRAILRAQVEVLGHVLNQLRLTVIPLLWMVVPVLILISQLQFHYGYSGLEPGEEALVRATFRPTSSEGEKNFADPKPRYSLRAPEGVTVESPTVWAPEDRELLWKVRVDAPGDYDLEIVGPSGEITTKTLTASDEIVRRSPRRPGGGFFDALLYPSEDPLGADSPFAAIEILSYEDAEVSVFGWHLNWLIAFLLISIVLAFALRDFVGVTF